MIGFFIKKNFFDGWDHLLSLVLPNLVIFALMMGGYFLADLALSLSVLASFVVFAIFWCGISVATFAFGSSAAEIANFKSVTFKDWLGNFPSVWKDGLLFGIITIVLLALGTVTIPFYLRIEGYVGLFLAAMVFWFLFVCILSLQWFLPIRSLMKNDFKKCLKKSFVIFFDNPGFSFFMFIYTVFLVVVSIAFFMIVPSFCGIVLAHTNGLRLRLYKYDWLEEHPDASPAEKKRIPWKELVAEDRENVGPRTLKNFIFPWK
ncbi:MAG: hypothetical protein IKK79_01630 [Spirochaetaceae bacterium]|nr:hypothetical protein [Spirochaetaceae bacterium]MBR6565491.1 hypothetical protein [Spirochaetaceae bacterium]